VTAIWIVIENIWVLSSEHSHIFDVLQQLHKI